MIHAKIVKGHDVLPDTDYHEWVLTGHPAVNRHGGIDWLGAHCNNPDCTGEAVISKAAVIALLEESERSAAA